MESYKFIDPVDKNPRDIKQFSDIAKEKAALQNMLLEEGSSQIKSQQQSSFLENDISQDLYQLLSNQYI